ncbi:MAG: S41 family peptidase [Bacteroidota bacterium]
MKKIFAFYLFFLPIWANAQDINSKLTKEEALEDIRFLKEALEKSHPGMHRFTPKEAMDEAYSQTISAITNTSLIKFYGEVSKLLSLINCGHTQAELSNSTLDPYINDLLRIPFNVSFLERKMVVSKDFSADQKIERGAEIISIDGINSEDVVSKLFERINGDGFVQSFKYEFLELYFWLLYPLYLTDTGLPQSYTIEYKKPFEEARHKVVVKGLSPIDIEEKKVEENQGSESRSLILEHDFALLTIKSFSGGRFDNYYSFLKKSFKTINESGVKNLIVDLRDNGGGADDYGIKLVTYLANSDFNYFDRIEVTEYYANQNESVKSENGVHYWPNHPGLSEWSADENRFEGNVYVLINGISFSTTADVASVLFDNQWATFIGQETGGGAYGNTSGHAENILLPNSKINVSIPFWMYFTALKNKYPKGRGVIPDYITTPSMEEFINNVDVEMEKAISLIRQN